jgi:hypothetical protein
MPLPAANLLAAVEAPLLAAPPVVLADCESTMPALGSGFRPSFSLKRRRNALFSFSQVPSSLHALK